MATYLSTGIGMFPGNVGCGMTATGLVRPMGALSGWLPAMTARCIIKAIGRTTTASMRMTTAAMTVIAITELTTKEWPYMRGGWSSTSAPASLRPDRALYAGPPNGSLF